MFGRLTSSTIAPWLSKYLTPSSTACLTSSSIPAPKYSFGRAIFLPLISPVMILLNSGTSTGALVMSLASNPEMISNTRALSFTVRVIGPIWSNDEANATNPKRDTRPYVGFNPTIPQ